MSCSLFTPACNEAIRDDESITTSKSAKNALPHKKYSIKSFLKHNIKNAAILLLSISLTATYDDAIHDN